MKLYVLRMMSSITALAYLVVSLPYGPSPSQTQQIYRELEANIGALGLKTILMAGVSTRGGAFGNRSQKHQSIYTGETWVQKFCHTPGNEFFVEVPESFLRESMNLIDIGRGVDIPYYNQALGLLIGETRVTANIHGDVSEEESMIESSAALLYGLLHARFIVSSQGLKIMLEKFSNADFGRCPRVLCQGQPVLPVGETDRPMQSSVKVFCPRCGDLYFPSSYVRACDGAFWGTTFPHLLLLGCPELKTAPNTRHYTPRIFGFKIHASKEGDDVDTVHKRDAQDHAPPDNRRINFESGHDGKGTSNGKTAENLDGRSESK